MRVFAFFASQPAESPVGSDIEVPPIAAARLRTRNRFAVVATTGHFLLFWLIAILLQLSAGAYHTELAGYPDEPSHYVTGLMIRDYIVSGFPTSPIAFAKEYYSHYPKVAFGHWPPFFHTLEALWMMFFTESRTSILALMALFTALSATILTLWFAKLFGHISLILVGLIWVSLPAIQEETSMVMLEMLFAAVTLLAVAALDRYLVKPSGDNALRLGLLTLLSIMTKGNGWLMVPAIFVALVVAGKFRLVFDRSMWVVAGITAIAIPEQLLTARSVVAALPEQIGIGYFMQSLFGFTLMAWQIVGPAVCLLVLLGLTAELVLPILHRRPINPAAATMTGLLCRFVLLHCIVPAGVEPRKLIVALPAILYFALSGATRALAMARLGASVFPSSTAAALMLAAMIVTGRIGHIPQNQGTGSHRERSEVATMPSRGSYPERPRSRGLESRRQQCSATTNATLSFEDSRCWHNLTGMPATTNPAITLSTR